MTVESLAWFLIVVAVFGLIVGAVARLLIPGPTPLGVIGTMAAGIAGALLGGLFGRIFLGPNLTQGWVWVLSILGATLVVWLVSRRSRSYGGRPARRRLMWERPADHQVGVGGVGAGDRPYRSHHGRWSPRALLAGRASGGRADVHGAGRGYRPAGLRRFRRF